MLTNFFLLLLLLLSSDCFHHLLFYQFFQIYTMTTMENSLDPDQVQPFLLGLIWVLTVCKHYQAMTIQVGVRMPNFLLYTYFLLQIIEPKPIGGNLPLFLMIMSRYSEASVKRRNPFV